MAGDLKDVSDRLNKAGGGKVIKAVETLAEVYALETLDKTRQLMRTKLTPRTGRLIGSLRHTVKRRGATVEVTVSSGGGSGAAEVRYAAVHEVGSNGPITAKNGKYLRLPLPAALTGAGVDRNSNRSVRNDDSFKFVPTTRLKGNNPLLVKVDTLVPWYVLKESVTIPARPTLGPAAVATQKRLQKDLGELFTIAVPVVK